jgi:hypothetical protein
MEHDHAYKLLFARPELVADLLRDFVREPWVETLDLATLDRVSASFVSTDLREREGDVIWRVRTAEGWLYVYLLIEFQSSVDRHMAVRLLVYVGLLYQDLIARGEGLIDGRLPPVVPIVLYNGERRWTAARDIAELIAPGPAGGGLERYRPQLRYLLLDEGRYAEAELAPLESLLAAVFRLEASAGSTPLVRALALALRTLREPRYAEARAGFLTWLRRVLLPGRFPGLELPEGLKLAEDEAMLAERVKEWTRVWRQEGLEQGLEQGLERGLAAERRMLLRLIERRFGAATAEAAVPLLARIDRPEPFEQVGEWVIDYELGEDFLARLRTWVAQVAE